MKKTWLLIILLIATLLAACSTYTNSIPPPEFDLTWEGDGVRVLVIDDFTGWYDNHGQKTTWVLYDAYPMAEVVSVDLYDAKGFHWQEDFDLIIVMPWFENEKDAKRMLPDRILEADAVKIAPAGNEYPPYDHDNAIDKWFVLVGAMGHEDWCQGEIQWNENEDMEGSCGATADFATAIMGQIIDERMGKRIGRDQN